MSENYRVYYHLEDYLFGEVTRRFASNKRLNAFDFFCIIIWKANRAKSRIAKKLLTKSADLETAVAELTSALAAAEQPAMCLSILIEEWGFRLPMASAILTVLFPEEFSVYDIRVCEELGGFHSMQNQRRFDDLWNEYQSYLTALRAHVPEEMSLRDKDRWLWGKSFVCQLRSNIADGFQKVPE